MAHEFTSHSADFSQRSGSLQAIKRIRVDCQEVDLRLETDVHLTDQIEIDVIGDSFAPTLKTNGTEIIIYQRGRYRGNHAPVVVRLPLQGCPPLSGKIDRGDLELVSVNADAAVRVGAGDVRISNCTGTLTLDAAKGDIECEAHSGDVAITNGSGDVRIAHVSGDVEIAVGHGGVHLQGTSGLGNVRSGSGDIVAKECTGRLGVMLGSGDVVVTTPRAMLLTVKNGNGDIVIKDGSLVGCNVRVARGDIVSTAHILAHSGRQQDIGDGEEPTPPSDADDTVTQLLRSHGVDFEAGDHGLRFTMPGFNFEASDAGLRITKGQSSFVAGDRGVRVVIGNATTPGTFDLETSKGDVAVDVPFGTPLRIEALVNRGSVKSDVPLVSVGRPGPRGTVQRFVGVTDPSTEGRVSVRIKTDRGDVRVRGVHAAPPVYSTDASPRPSPETTPSDAPGSSIALPSPTPQSREERMRTILDDLARGAISIDEADRLLMRLDEPSD